MSTTPAALWREQGDPDPHGDLYDCDRLSLCKGVIEDKDLANHLSGDIGHLTALKERIRWLSRKVLESVPDNELSSERATLPLGKLTDDQIANAVYLETSFEKLKAASARILWLSEKLETITQEVA